MGEMMHLSAPFWHFIVRGTLVYGAVLLLLRLGGKREVGQMGTGEFVAILLISNAVQNSMNGGDNSITGGLILAVVIIAWSTLIAYITYRSKKAADIIVGSPTLLIHNGKILDQNLRKELLSHDELKAILRRQGIHDISDIHAAILESDGDVSVTHMSEMNYNGKKDDQSV
ncbi:MAG: DUF421 domain-containing protein [Armatimonadota bacterium]